MIKLLEVACWTALVACMVTIVSLLVVPTVKWLLHRSGCSTVQLNMYTPWSYKGILVELPCSLWGISKLTLFIPHLSLALCPYLRITISKPQLFLVRTLSPLLPVNLIHPLHQASVLLNFFEFIQPNTRCSDPKSQSDSADAKLPTCVDALLSFLCLSLLQVTRVALEEPQVVVVSGMPQKLDYSSFSARKRTILLMQYMAQYQFNFDTVRLAAGHAEHSHLTLKLECPRIAVSSQCHLADLFCEAACVELRVTVPVSLSLQHSLLCTTLHLSVAKLHFKTVPTDFDQFFELLHQLLFDPHNHSSDHSNAGPAQSSNAHSLLTLQIHEATLELSSIYEAEHDNPEAQQALSNIVVAGVSLLNVRLEDQHFNVQTSGLSVCKHKDGHLLTHQVFTIPVLDISQQGSQLLITHQAVSVVCDKEEVALLAKLFSLVSNRLRFDNYDSKVYPKTRAKASLVHSIDSSLCAGELPADSAFNPGQARTVIYSPQCVQFQLQIESLRHTVQLEAVRYTQDHSAGQIKHSLSVQSACVKYLALEEFAVRSLQLEFAQSMEQDELRLHIESISMDQNRETLVDYLDSFTRFKEILLCQPEKSQQQTALKTIRIKCIQMHYNHQAFTLHCLAVTKTPQHLHFSLSHCSVELEAVPSQPHSTLFSVQSVTVELSPAAASCQVTVEQPSLSLPHCDISERLGLYLKDYLHMQKHIQAYFKNISSQKLELISCQLHEFLSQPDLITFTLVRPHFTLADAPLDLAVQTFNRTIRTYLSKLPKYNEIEVISTLKRNVSLHSLLSLDLQSVVFRLVPVPQLLPTEQSIRQWIESYSADSVGTPPGNDSRLRRVQAVKLEMVIESVALQVRDYPLATCQLDRLQLSLAYLSKQHIFGQTSRYCQGHLDIGGSQASIGLGQYAGLKHAMNQLMRPISRLALVLSEASPSSQQSSALLGESWQSVWKSSHCSIGLSKTAISSLNILTGHTPYTQDYFELTLGALKGHLQPEKSSMQVQSLSVKFKHSPIVSLPSFQFEVLARLHGSWQDIHDRLQVSLAVNCTEGLCYMAVTDSLAKYVSQMQELRTEWLSMQGIYRRQPRIVNEHMLNRELRRLHYMDLLSEGVAAGLSDYLQLFRIKIAINKFYYLLSTDECGLHFVTHDLQAHATFRPSNSKTIVCTNFILSLERLIGKIAKKPDLKLDLATLLAEYEANMARLQAEEDRRKRHKFEKLIFVICKQASLQLGRYFAHNGRTYHVDYLISAKIFKAELSHGLLKLAMHLVKAFAVSVQPVSASLFRKQTCIETFRKAVLTVMRNNRLKLSRKTVPTLNLVLKVDRVEVALRSLESTLTVMSEVPAVLTVTEHFADNFATNSNQLHFSLHRIAMYLQQSTLLPWFESVNTQAHLILNAELFELEINRQLEMAKHEGNSSGEGRCVFRSGTIQLDSNGKDMLIDFILFLIDACNTNEVRKRNYRINTDKYAELVNYGKHKLQSKIQWRQSDLQHHAHTQLFHWRVSLSQMQICLLQPPNLHRRPFLKVASQCITIHMHLHSSLRIELRISCLGLCLTNEMEPQDGEYRQALQLSQADHDSESVSIVLESYQVQAYSESYWNFCKQLSVVLCPITVKMTQELKDELIGFFLSESSPADDLNSYDQYKDKIPGYIRSMTLAPIGLELSFRSSNVFMRMQAIKLQLDQYRVESSLQTARQLLEAWCIFLAKQLASQVVSVLSQKIFG